MKAFYNTRAAEYHLNIFGNFYGTYGIAKSTYLPDFLL